MSPDNLLSAADQPPAHGFVRLGPLTSLPVLVRDLGGDVDTVFAGAGFDPTGFDDPGVAISFVAGSRLLARCVRATGCEQLGLLLGQRAEVSSLGVPGFMLQSAARVGTALGELVRYLDLHDRGAVVSLDGDNQVAMLGYSIHLTGVEAVDVINDLAMTMVCVIMRRLCGPSWNPTEILLSRREPPDSTPYRRFFRAPLRFSSDRNSVVFPGHWLNRPIAGADALLHRHLEQEAIRLRAQKEQSLLSDLRPLLCNALAHQRATAAEIASQLGMHERTLNRHLRAEGTNFQQILSQVRYELAQQMLAENSMPLSNIAVALNYSDVAAFSRAFKRWSGHAPGKWRTRHRQR